jgi:hypothetical protein
VPASEEELDNNGLFQFSPRGRGNSDCLVIHAADERPYQLFQPTDGSAAGETVRFEFDSPTDLETRDGCQLALKRVGADPQEDLLKIISIIQRRGSIGRRDAGVADRDNGGGCAAAFVPRLAPYRELQPGKGGFIKPDDRAFGAGAKSDGQVPQLHEVSPSEKVGGTWNIQAPCAKCFQQNVFPLASIGGSQHWKLMQGLDASPMLTGSQDIPPPLKLGRVEASRVRAPTQIR